MDRHALASMVVLHAAAAALPRPIRGWAFPYNMSGDFALYEQGSVNLLTTYAVSQGQNASELAARGVASLAWAYCWDDPDFKKSDPNCTGTNCTVANASLAVETFAAYATVDRSPSAAGSGGGPAVAGRGLDEPPAERNRCAPVLALPRPSSCRRQHANAAKIIENGFRLSELGRARRCNLSNEQFADEREMAAEGFREARRRQPDTVVAAWGAQDEDDLFASLMRDGTFDLAMIEGYTYCPGCGDWPASGDCCPVVPICAKNLRRVASTPQTALRAQRTIHVVAAASMRSCPPR